MPASLYTGKARSFLRKRRIPFDERTPGDPVFRRRQRSVPARRLRRIARAAAPGPTLEAVLRFVADEWLADLAAQVAFADAWLAQRPDLAAGTNGLERPGDRAIGRTAFE
jgi:hypothetical protein